MVCRNGQVALRNRRMDALARGRSRRPAPANTRDCQSISIGEWPSQGGTGAAPSFDQIGRIGLNQVALIDWAAPVIESFTFPTPVRVILVPIGKDAEQAVGPFPQWMPAGLLETVPIATPSSVTVSFPGAFTKVAATVLAALGTATTHEAPLALAQPLQPPICEPPAGNAVSVTFVPTAKANAQTVPDEPHKI